MNDALSGRHSEAAQMVDMTHMCITLWELTFWRGWAQVKRQLPRSAVSQRVKKLVLSSSIGQNQSTCPFLLKVFFFLQVICVSNDFSNLILNLIQFHTGLLKTYYVQPIQSNIDYASGWWFWKGQHEGDENTVRKLYSSG